MYITQPERQGPHTSPTDNRSPGPLTRTPSPNREYPGTVLHTLPQKLRHEKHVKRDLHRSKETNKRNPISSQVNLDIVPAHLASKNEIRKFCPKRPADVKKTCKRDAFAQSSIPRYSSHEPCLK